MKVVHILRELNHSGAERMLECSFEQWRDAGIEPIVLGMGTGPHDFGPALTRAGYPVRLLPDARSARGLRALRRTLSDLRPRIVHVHSERCFDLIAATAAAVPGVKGIVRTVHSNFCFDGSLRLRRRVRMYLARRWIGVVWVACSEEVAATERTYEGAATLVAENWIDVARIGREATAHTGIETRRRLGIPPDANVVTLVGNCGYPKNHEFVPGVLDHCGVPVRLLHVGSQRNRPQAECGAWRRLADRHEVHHLGQRDDVPALLAASDLLLLPSLYEGFPLAAIEALCAGVPVLASDAVGLRWLAEMRAAISTPLDPETWVAAIDAVLADRSGWRERARADAEEGRARFTPDRGVAEYAAIYRACG
jgi:glycosyltransferase involved in cell wall biosynthesis